MINGKEIKTKAEVFFGVNTNNHTNESVIQISCAISGLQIAEITLNPVQLTQLLGGMGGVDGEMTYYNNGDNIGKVRESMTLEFEIPEKYNRYDNDDIEEIKKLAEKNCPDGWVASTYFRSQNSFFRKDGKSFARTNAFRWVDESELSEPKK